MTVPYLWAVVSHRCPRRVPELDCDHTNWIFFGTCDTATVDTGKEERIQSKQLICNSCCDDVRVFIVDCRGSRIERGGWEFVAAIKSSYHLVRRADSGTYNYFNSS